MYRFWIYLMLAVVLALGCSRNPSGPRTPSINYINHGVKYEGETLALIASWYTRSSANWKEILTHNPGLDVYRIRPGQIIRIPETLVKRSTPMPKEFVQSIKAPAAINEDMPSTESQETSAPPPSPSVEQAASQAEAELSAEPLLQREPLGPPEKALPEAGRSVPIIEEEPTALTTAAEAVNPPTEAPAPTVVIAAPTVEQAPRIKSRDELLRELLEVTPSTN